MSTIDSLSDILSDEINNYYETKSILTNVNTIMSKDSVPSAQAYNDLYHTKGFFKADTIIVCNQYPLPTSMNDLVPKYDECNIAIDNNRYYNKSDILSDSISLFDVVSKNNETFDNEKSTIDDNNKSGARQLILLDERTLHYYNSRNEVDFAIFNNNFNYLNEVKDVNEYDPIHIAVLHRNSSSINYMVNDRKCFINKLDINNETPLLLAVKKGYLDMIITLFKDFKSHLFIKSNGRSAFHYSVIYNRLYILKYFIDSNLFDIYDKDNDGNNILHLACMNGYYDIVEYLLLLKYDTYITNNNNQTAALISLNMRHEAIVDLFQSHNLSNITNNYNQTAELIHDIIHEAAIDLIQSHNRSNITNNYNQTAELIHDIIHQAAIVDLIQIHNGSNITNNNILIQSHSDSNISNEGALIEEAVNNESFDNKSRLINISQVIDRIRGLQAEMMYVNSCFDSNVTNEGAFIEEAVKSPLYRPYRCTKTNKSFDNESRLINMTQIIDRLRDLSLQAKLDPVGRREHMYVNSCFKSDTIMYC